MKAAGGLRHPPHHPFFDESVKACFNEVTLARF
ncbi:hypothetical protein DEV92_11198 [Phyllobacterium myrsinacearum]|nr:hypothetical protein DEV92_11198 [Phyllobacterium myrsinacearum]RZS88733.1 hypothetical protein EV217_1120 [Phyllobacterium myrsinacearum]RZU97582.1 hypothetical protein EV654_4442 [Phyllobacterium myrsinacearum]